MVAITGVHLPRPAEIVTLWLTALAVAATVIVPVLYVVALPAVCALAAMTAPGGRRLPTAMAAWFPVSAALFIGTAGSGGLL